MSEKKFTCQIRGRAIKASKGVIAHHGYTRPGDGWQTASCMGARHLPYEVSRDLIPVAIKAASEFIDRSESALKELMTNPPAQLSKTEFKGSYSRGELIIVERPVDFDPTSKRRSYQRNAYDTLFFARINNLEGSIRAAKYDVEFLTQRYEAWVAPEEASNE